MSSKVRRHTVEVCEGFKGKIPTSSAQIQTIKPFQFQSARPDGGTAVYWQRQLNWTEIWLSRNTDNMFKPSSPEERSHGRRSLGTDPINKPNSTQTSARRTLFILSVQHRAAEVNPDQSIQKPPHFSLVSMCLQHRAPTGLQPLHKRLTSACSCMNPHQPNSSFHAHGTKTSNSWQCISCLCRLQSANELNPDVSLHLFRSSRTRWEPEELVSVWTRSSV